MNLSKPTQIGKTVQTVGAMLVKSAINPKSLTPKERLVMDTFERTKLS